MPICKFNSRRIYLAMITLSKIFSFGQEYYCATFSANEGDGYFAMGIYDGNSQFSYSFNLSRFDTSCNISEYGMNYNIHSYWAHTNVTSATGLTLCGESYTGGHFDPNLACSPNSQSISTSPGCPSLNRIAADGYSYYCNTSTYTSQDYASCEVGDLSGKFGLAYFGEGGTSTVSSLETITDFYPPYAVNFEHGVENSQFMWESIVFNCGDSGNEPLFCAQFSQSDLTSCQSEINKFFSSSSSDDFVSNTDDEVLNYNQAVIVSVLSSLSGGIILGIITMKVYLNRKDGTMIS